MDFVFWGWEEEMQGCLKSLRNLQKEVTHRFGTKIHVLLCASSSKFSGP